MRLALALLALLVLPAPAAAQLTPDGPATVWGRWFGASTAEGRGPEVLVGYRVIVRDGSRADNIRLRVLSGDDSATVRFNGPWERLPSERGTYEFGFQPGVRYDYREVGLALDQESGGLAIVEPQPSQPENGRYADPYQLNGIDVFRPPLADDARDQPYSERRQGERLLIAPIIEPDGNGNLLGDFTQDMGDIRLVRARVLQRSPGRVLIGATVRDLGPTGRRLRVDVPDAALVPPCQPRRHGDTEPDCAPPRVGPGQEIELVFATPSEPSRVTVGTDGPESNPADNSLPLAPHLTLVALRGRRVALSSTQPGTARLVARVGRTRVVRSVRFVAAGRRIVHLHGHGRLVVIATLRGGRAILRSR